MHFAELLQNRISSGLPGVSAQSRMAPASRLMQPFRKEDFPDARIGCVLILLHEKENGPVVTLIQRPVYDGVHGGQVSFPGGQMEAADADEWAAALREGFEEVGVEGTAIYQIGKLSPVYIPPSNFFVHPFLAWTPRVPAYSIDTHEVERVIELPLRHLLKAEAKSSVQINRPGAQFEAPCYVYENTTIWGATAIILSELEMLVAGLF